MVGWETRSRTSIHRVRVARRQKIKNDARRIKRPKILRKVGTRWMTGSPWEVGKGIRPVTKSPTRRHTGRGAESIAPLPVFFHLIVEKEGGLSLATPCNLPYICPRNSNSKN